VAQVPSCVLSSNTDGFRNKNFPEGQRNCLSTEAGWSCAGRAVQQEHLLSWNTCGSTPPCLVQELGPLFSALDLSLSCLHTPQRGPSLG
jgi:hypothetical protein